MVGARWRDRARRGLVGAVGTGIHYHPPSRGLSARGRKDELFRDRARPGAGEPGPGAADLAGRGRGGAGPPAHAAATITVSSCDESDLDAAIAQANSDNAGDTITFSCSGTIDLTSTLDITGSMTLDGTGQQVALDGQNQVRVLSVSSGVTFAINRLTVQDGSVTGDGQDCSTTGGR